VVAACWTCNAEKGDRTPEEWSRDGGPTDAAERAQAETQRQPSPRALAIVREIYDLPVPGTAAWSTPDPPPPYGSGPARKKKGAPEFRFVPVRGNCNETPPKRLLYGTLADARNVSSQFGCVLTLVDETGAEVGQVDENE